MYTTRKMYIVTVSLVVLGGGGEGEEEKGGERANRERERGRGISFVIPDEMSTVALLSGVFR